MSFNDLESGLNSFQESTFETDEDIQQYKYLTQRIAQQIFHINGNISNAEKLIGFLCGARDTEEIRDNLHKVTESTRDLIKGTTQDLKTLSYYSRDTVDIIDSKQSHQRKMEQQKLSKDFKNVVAHFQNVQKTSASKQRESVDQVKGTAIQQLDTLNEERRQEQMQETETFNNEVEYNELLILERETEIENIEQGVIELNDIFRDLSFVVNDQESGIQSIYGNVLSIAQNTKQAAGELVTANRHQKNTRRSMCWFLIIITMVGFMLALILVLA